MASLSTKVSQHGITVNRGYDPKEILDSSHLIFLHRYTRRTSGKDHRVSEDGGESHGVLVSVTRFVLGIDRYAWHVYSRSRCDFASESLSPSRSCNGLVPEDSRQQGLVSCL